MEVLDAFDEKARPLRLQLDKLENDLLTLRSTSRHEERSDAFSMMNSDLAAAETNEDKFIIRTRIANMLGEIISHVICYQDGYIAVFAKGSADWKLEHYYKGEVHAKREGIVGFELLPDAGSYRVLQWGTQAMAPEDLSDGALPWQPGVFRSRNLVVPPK